MNKYEIQLQVVVMEVLGEGDVNHAREVSKGHLSEVIFG